jgi:hypothetical protein
MANLFAPSSNKAPPRVAAALLILAITVTTGIAYYFTPKYTRVGYAPIQPVPYNHFLHVEQLGLDCRFCHTHVDQSGRANIPDTSTCMNCHAQVKRESLALAPLRAAHESGEPLPWVRIHQLPDYVYFNHAVHVNRGVSCVECHGQVNEMVTVRHDQPLSMAFCLECHRKPEQFIRPLEHVFDLNWTPDNPAAQATAARQAVIDWNINPPQSCSGCHR